MIGGLTTIVFLLVAGGSFWIGLKLDTRRRRSLERLGSEPKLVPKEVFSAALIWRELVNRIGSVLPASEKDLPLLKRRLIRAGIRRQSAPGYFQGARGVGTVAFG